MIRQPAFLVHVDNKEAESKFRDFMMNIFNKGANTSRRRSNDGWDGRYQQEMRIFGKLKRTKFWKVYKRLHK
jgi:hypothetical protein